MVESPNAAKVDDVYSSLASVEVNSRFGGGGAVFGERKYGNWSLVERSVPFWLECLVGEE